MERVTWRARIVPDRANPGFYVFKTKPKYQAPIPPPKGRMLIPLPGDCFINEFDSIPMYKMGDNGSLISIHDSRVNLPCGKVENAAKKKDKFVPLDRNR